MKEAVGTASADFAPVVACDGCPPFDGLLDRYEAVGGTAPLWEWIGQDCGVSLSY